MEITGDRYMRCSCLIFDSGSGIFIITKYLYLVVATRQKSSPQYNRDEEKYIETEWVGEEGLSK